MRAGAAALLAAALALVAAPVAAQTKPDSVVLTFAWPLDIVAEVDYTQIIDREGDTDTPTHLEITGDYEMHVHAREQGLLIEHLDPVAARFRSSPTLPPSDPRRIVYSTIGTPLPDWVVTKGGEFVEIEGLEALEQSITEAVQRVAPGADVVDVIGQMAQRELLYNSAAERWRAMVGDWVGAVLKEGEMGSGEGTEANPVIPTLAVGYSYQYKLNGMRPCAAPGGTCALIELSRLYDPVELNKTMNDALQQMGMTNVSFDGLAQETHVLLLTDPKTLLPYQMGMTKGVEGILLMGGERRVFRRSDEIELDFTYRK